MPLIKYSSKRIGDDRLQIIEYVNNIWDTAVKIEEEHRNQLKIVRDKWDDITKNIGA